MVFPAFVEAMHNLVVLVGEDHWILKIVLVIFEKLNHFVFNIIFIYLFDVLLCFIEFDIVEEDLVEEGFFAGWRGFGVGL